MNCIKKWNREKWIDVSVFAVGFVIYTVLLFILFHRQTLGNEQVYASDMKAYILEMLGQNTMYSFPYPIFFKLGALFHLVLKSPELCIALAATVLNSLSTIVLKIYMNRSVLSVVGGDTERKRILKSVLVTAATFSIFFVSMLYFPNNYLLPGLHFKYAGIFSPNPFHNATYMATRPFAIVAFFLFARILTRYEKETDWKENLLFGLFLLLTTMTKPSFTFVLVPTAGLIMLYRLLKCRFGNFRQSLYLGLCFVPTFGVLLYQFFGVFVPVDGGERGIGFALGKVWSIYSDNIFFSVALSCAFPLLVLLLHLKEFKKNSMLLFAWQLFAVSFLEAFAMFEKGFRMKDFNFSWGYMHGLFFVFVASLIVLLRDTFATKKKCWLLAVQWLLYAAHLACGLWYFRGIFLGGAWR
ncbi:MAG: hypothetical protein E7293_00315 [Lachnospiraceae bacterium]|nr:hypothetical protein [Lachnospiraceae bacterium]